MTNSSQDRVKDDEEGRQQRRPQHGHGDQISALQLAGAEIAGGALDIRLMLAHLAE